MKIKSLATAFAVAFFSLSAYAETYDIWSLNFWGNPAPVFVKKQSSDEFCGKDGRTSQYLKLASKGGGSAEIILSGLLKPGKAYSLKAFMRSEAAGNVDLFFRRDAFPYETSAILTVPVTTEWKEAELKGIFTPSGAGSVRIAVKEGGPGLCVNNATLKELSYKEVGTSSAPAPVSPQFFGVHINKLGAHNEWPGFNPGLVRLWDTGTTWALLKPDNLPIKWDTNQYARRLDYYISYVTKNNPTATLIYTAAMTPTWAGGVNPRNCANSSYGIRSCSKPANLDDWRQFIKEMAVRYKGVIRVWELWNEVDIWYQWNGSSKDMVEMARVAHEELKAADSSNVLIGPNITTGGISFLNEFLTQGGGQYIDGFSVHGYLGRSPDMALNFLRNMMELISEHDLSLPIWNTETGVSCNSIFETCNAVAFKNEKYLDGDIALAMGLIGNAALGVLNFSYYTWEGVAPDVGGLPLVSADFKTPTSTSLVISRVRFWIEGAVLQYNYLDNEFLSVISVEKKDLKGFVVWSKDQPLKVNVTQFPGVSRMWALRAAEPSIINTASITVGVEPVFIY